MDWICGELLIGERRGGGEEWEEGSGGIKIIARLAQLVRASVL